MRKTVFLLFSLVTVFVKAQGSVDAYIYDHNGNYSNVRNAPGGAIVDKISDEEAMLVLTTPKNGWWKIAGGKYDTMESTIRLRGSSNGYWIHYSCVGFSTSNYGGQKLALRSTPSDAGRVVYSFTTEIMLRPIDVKGNWIKVKTENGKYEGWINKRWICANPVTNCC